MAVKSLAGERLAACLGTALRHELSPPRTLALPAVTLQHLLDAVQVRYPKHGHGRLAPSELHQMLRHHLSSNQQKPNQQGRLAVRARRQLTRRVHQQQRAASSGKLLKAVPAQARGETIALVVVPGTLSL